MTDSSIERGKGDKCITGFGVVEDVHIDTMKALPIAGFERQWGMGFE